MKTVLYTLLTAVGLVAAPCCFAQQTESQLIDVLKSAASQQQKTDACIELSKIGSGKSVSSLATLLADAELAHMAVYALEPNPDPAAGEALRTALGHLVGRLRLIAIHALGRRQDGQAVGVLTGFLTGADEEAANAAAFALARIGTPEAIVSLKSALGKVPAAAEGLLQCAESASGEQAAALGDLLCQASLPLPLQAAAARRAILARGDNGIPQLLQQFKQKDDFLFNGALRTAMELPGTPAVSRALTAELPNLSDERQARLMGVLAERGDTAAGSVLLERAKNGTPQVVAAAIPALARLGYTDAVPLLAEQVTSSDPMVAEAALCALAGFPGTAADNAVLELLGQSALDKRNAGIRLAAQRRLVAAVPAALRLAMDSNTASGSLRLLKDLAEAKDIPALFDLLLKTSDPDAVAEVLNAVCIRQAAVAAEKTTSPTANGTAKNVSGDVSPAATEPVFSAYEKAQGAPKRALIRTLMLIGGDRALRLIRAAASDSDMALRETAIRSLCDWPTGSVLPDLEALATGSDSPKFRILALRGYVRLIISQDALFAEKSRALKKAFAWAVRDEERCGVLDALISAPTCESLELADSCLVQKGLSDEACRTVVALGEALAPAFPEPVAKSVGKVVPLCKDKGLLKRSDAVLRQTKTTIRARDAASDETGFTPMFNGKDLSGWDGKGLWWKVVDGVLTAETSLENPCKKSAYLLWKDKTPGDFELRTEFRLSKDANSGIQFRAGTVPEPLSGAYRFDPKAAGYQADMSGNGAIVGCFWHPVYFLVGRGATVTRAQDGQKEEKCFADSSAIQGLYRAGDWNTYRLICRGPEISLYLNGVLAARFIDYTPTAPKQGAIMLQVHQGSPMKAEYRNLRIKML